VTELAAEQILPRGHGARRNGAEDDARRGTLTDLVVGALAIAASASSLTNGFAYDDRWVILHNPRVHALARIWRLWIETYWPPNMGASLYRPVTMTGFALEWAAGHGQAWTFHLASVALYVVVCLAMARLARGTLPAWAAGVSAALFAVHPVHVEAVANIVGQSELLAALCAIAAVLLYIRWRRARLLGWRSVATLCALTALAAGAKEHGIVLPGLFALAEVTVVGDQRPAGERWREIRPLALALVATGLAYVAVRLRIVGAVAGDTPSVVFAHMGTMARAWTMLAVVPEWTRLLLWPARLVADYAPQDVTLYSGFDISLVPAAALLIATLALVVVSRRQWPAGAFGIGWTALTLVPVSNVLVPTGVILAERTLFLPSVGAMIAVGAVLATSSDWLRRSVTARWSGGIRVATIGVAGGLVIVGVWRSASRARTWQNSETVFAQEVRDARLSYRAHYVYAGSLFEHGQPAGGEHEARLAIALYPSDGGLHRDLGTQYMRAGMCAPAVPLFRDAIRLATGPTDARVLLAACLLELHDRDGARHEALQAVAEGGYSPDVHKLIAAAGLR
jgi:protein O-mannosyl-transferase